MCQLKPRIFGFSEKLQARAPHHQVDPPHHPHEQGRRGRLRRLGAGRKSAEQVGANLKL